MSCPHKHITSAYADEELYNIELNQDEIENFLSHFEKCGDCKNFYKKLVGIKKYFFENTVMPTKNRCFFILFFASCVIGANYALKTNMYIYHKSLLVGAIIYAFTFLLTDIVAERYGKKEAKKVFIWATIISAIPTVYIIDTHIAAASLLALVISQSIDIYIFHELKRRYQKLWWLRNNCSTLTSQLLDTCVFYSFAFPGDPDLLTKILIYYTIKVVMALADTPFFYFFAIRPLRPLEMVRLTT